MKLHKFLWISFFCTIVQGNAQDLYSYYESLVHSDGIRITSIQKEVDSMLHLSEKNEKYDQSIRIAHEFSRKLFKKKRYEKAIKYGKYELSLYRKLGVKNDKYSKALYNVGLFYYRLGIFEKAIPYYQEVIAINTNEYRTAKAYCKLANYYYIKGDFYRSVDYYTYGIAALEKINKKKFLIKKYLDYSNVLYQIGTKSSLDKMLQVLDKANVLFSLVPDYSRLDWNILNNDYANYYTIKERLDFFKARYYSYRNLKKAIKDNDSTFIYSAYTSLGALYVDANEQKDSTIFFLDNGLKYARKRNEKSVVYHQFSHYYLETNEYQKALDNIQKSLIFSTQMSNDISALPKLHELKVSDNKHYILLALIQKATILIKRYQEENNDTYIELALSNLLAADALVDILLDVSTEEGSRLMWRKEASEIYIKGILVCEILLKKETAFYFSEKKKALLLIDDIIKNTNTSQLPDTLLEKGNEFKKTILDIENRIETQKNRDSSTVLESKRFELKQQYQKHKDSLQLLFPEYYKHKQTAKILDLKNIQETLDTETVIVSYVANQDEYDDSFSVIYAVLVSQNETEIIKIGVLDQIEKLVISYRYQVSKPFETKEDKLRFQEVASELYKILIPKDKISMSLNQKHLIIIPDGTLQYIPFESLVVDKNTNRYLLEDNEISYAYSMSFSQYNTAVQRKASKDIVAFAPVNFKHSDLEDIANSTNEMNAIGNKLPLITYKEKEASKLNFLSNTFDYKVIHLTTHANFSDNLQIAFHDTNLEYHELYTSKNQAELVVLSACNTSLGKIAKGEGVMSLARGFFYAGANTVISSLWNANDKSTAQIMGIFYTNLDKGQTKSKALHNAKIKYLKSASLSDTSPHYWATFVLIGDAETKLFFSNNLYYGIFLLFFLILVIRLLISFLKIR